MKKNILRRIWLCVFMLGMYCHGFALEDNGTIVINVFPKGNAGRLDVDTPDNEVPPSKPTDAPRHTPQNKEQRISVEFLFHDAFGDICVSILKDDCNIVYEDGIAVFSESSLQYDLTLYGHGSYYICIKNGSAVLHDEKVEL